MEEVEVEEEGEGLVSPEVKGGAKTEVEAEEVVMMTTPFIQSSTYQEVSTSTYDNDRIGWKFSNPLCIK